MLMRGVDDVIEKHHHKSEIYETKIGGKFHNLPPSDSSLTLAALFAH